MPVNIEIVAGVGCTRAVNDKTGNSCNGVARPLGFGVWHQKQSGYIGEVSIGTSVNILPLTGSLCCEVSLTKQDTVQELRAQKEALEKKIDKLANDAASEFGAC